MNWNLIKDYMNSFMGIILLTLPFFFIPEIKKSKLYIIFFLVATVTLLWLGTDKMIRDDKEKQRNSAHTDSVVKKAKDDLTKNVDSALKTHDMQYNPQTKTITIRDTSEKVIAPVMEMVLDSARLVGTFPDSLKLRIVAGCIKGIAFHIVPRIIAFTMTHDNFILKGETHKVEDLERKSFLHVNVFIETPVKPQPGISEYNNIDTTYFFYTAIYKNKEVGGQIQPKLRSLYKLTCSPYPKSLNDLKISEVTDQVVYGKLKYYMIKYKYW